MKYVALVLGIVLLALGIAAFVPQASIDGELFGVVPVSVEMALVLIGVGAMGIMAGVSTHSRSWSRRFRQATTTCGSGWPTSRNAVKECPLG